MAYLGGFDERKIQERRERRRENRRWKKQSIIDNPTMTAAKERVHELVTTFQRYFHDEHGIVVTEIVKGGSMGHGTAVPGHFDLDMVLYSRDINRDKVAKDRDGQYIGSILNKLEIFIEKHFHCNVNKRSHGVNFVLHDIEVDLLPSPFFRRRRYLHRFLQRQTPDVRRRFSCSAAKWEAIFFQQQVKSKAKEYIKSAKKWRNRTWPKSEPGLEDHTEGRPKSLLISVLMAEACRRCQPFYHAADVAREFKNIVKNHHTQCIDLVGYKCGVQEQVPHILDPANPFNNLHESAIANYTSGEGTYAPGDGNWTEFVRLIDTFTLDL